MLNRKTTTIFLVALFLISFVTIFQKSIPNTFASTTVTLNPTDDCTVDRNDVNTNFNAAGYLADGSNGLSNPRYQFYMKFDLTSLAGKVIDSVFFNLSVYSSHTVSSTALYIKQVANTTWIESTITYTNKPAIGSTIYTGVVGEAVGWHSYSGSSITSYVSSCLGGKMSVAWDAVGGTNEYTFYRDKEYSSGAAKPQLVITYHSAYTVALSYSFTLTRSIGQLSAFTVGLSKVFSLSQSIGTVSSFITGLSKAFSLTSSMAQVSSFLVGLSKSLSFTFSLGLVLTGIIGYVVHLGYAFSLNILPYLFYNGVLQGFVSQTAVVGIILLIVFVSSIAGIILLVAFRRRH